LNEKRDHIKKVNKYYTMLEHAVQKETIKNELGIDPVVLTGRRAKTFMREHDPWGHLFLNGLFVGEDKKRGYINTVAVKDPSKKGTLAHELFHAWQFASKKEYKKSVYLFSIKELDADLYALTFCKRMGLKKEEKEYKKKCLIKKRLIKHFKRKIN